MATSTPIITIVYLSEKEQTVKKYNAMGYKLIHEEQLPNNQVRLTFQK